MRINVSGELEVRLLEIGGVSEGVQQDDHREWFRGIEVRWPDHPNITSARIDVLRFGGDGGGEGHQEDGEKRHPRDEPPTSRSSSIWQKRTPEDSNHTKQSKPNDSRWMRLDANLRVHPVQ